MNDALKLLSKALKPLGYQVSKRGTPALLNMDGHALSKPYMTDGAHFDHMNIYVRTCIRTDRNIDTKPRITGASLEENTLRCLTSLVRAINFANRDISLIILDDRSDQESVQKIETVLKPLTCAWQIEQTKETGQGNSLYEQFQRAKEENALVYFCEDDYLHEQDAIKVCWDFYDQMTKEFDTHSFIYPQEHRSLYTKPAPSYIFLGADRKWRTIHNATHTFITHGHIVRDFWHYFENTKYVGHPKKRKLGSEAQTTNKLFQHIPAFSPMKPAAVHLQFDGTVPQLYDWQSLWESMKN